MEHGWISRKGIKAFQKFNMLNYGNREIND